LNYDVSDYGLESGEINGEAIILPNTIEPTPGDFFSVPYIKEDVLFKVISITTDTLDNGSNFYKIEYKLELINSTDKIEKQVVATYNFLVGNVGTDFNAVVSDDTYNLVSKLEVLLEEQCDLYQLFFDAGVQTFVYEYNGSFIYDPYLIEFLLRTKILSYAKDYIYVHHATNNLRKTFSYEYGKTIFKSIEDASMISDSYKYYASATKIEDINSLFVTRLEDYYQVDYFPKYTYISTFDILNEDLADRIKSNTYYDEGDTNFIYNLWIAYFNNDTSYLNESMIDIIRNYDYKNNKECFYMIPITMYILSKFTEGLMK